MKIPNNNLQLGDLYRRKAKVTFMQGKIMQTEKLLLRAKRIMVPDYQHTKEYGEILNLIAMLRMEEKKYK